MPPVSYHTGGFFKGDLGHMNFKNCRARDLLIHLGIAFLFPVYKYVSSTDSKLLYLINAATIVGMVFFVIGILYSFLLHGDLDVTEYFALTALKKNNKPYDAFKKDKKEQREGRFNYPLLVGVLMVIISAILTLIYY